MKTIKEILEIIKEEFNKKDYTGLCNIAFRLWSHDEIIDEEYELWKDYWRRYAKTQKVFYDYKGNKIPYNTGWAWRPYLKQPRNKWLDKHIKLNS